MSDEYLSRRVDKLERDHEGLAETIHDLNTTIALLNQTVEIMSKAEEKRQQFFDRTLLFVIGGFVAAAISWIVRGGLADG